MLTHNSTENLNKSDIPSLLSEAIQNGIIDLTDVQKKIDMTKREQYLNLHKESYNVWQGTNGNWYTYLPDSTKKQNRRLVKKSTLTKVEDEIIAYYKALEEKHQSKRCQRGVCTAGNVEASGRQRCGGAGGSQQ